MTLTFELPPRVEQVYLAEARARGLAVDDLVREVLICNQPVMPSAIEEGLGLFGSAEDSALLDEVVAMARDDRSRPFNEHANNGIGVEGSWVTGGSQADPYSLPAGFDGYHAEGNAGP